MNSVPSLGLPRALASVLTAAGWLVAAAGLGSLVAGCLMVPVASTIGSPAPKTTVDRSPGTPKSFMVGGAISAINRSTGTFTLRTPMNLEEVIRVDGRTQIVSGGSEVTWSDVQRGVPVRVDYQMEDDGGVLARRITLRQAVPFCRCGPDCRCPPSRGCRVIRQPSVSREESGSGNSSSSSDGLRVDLYLRR